MKIRHTTLGAALVSLAVLGGCDRSPTEAQNDAREAQRRAEEQAAEARARAEEAAASAQAKADEAAQRAEQELIKARNDLRNQAEKELNDLSAQIDELAVKAAKAKGKTKPEFDAAVRSLEEQRAAMKRDIEALGRMTATELEAAKQRFSVGFDSIRKSLNDASKRLGEPKI